jgi:hypothetical protein
MHGADWIVVHCLVPRRWKLRVCHCRKHQRIHRPAAGRPPPQPTRRLQRIGTGVALQNVGHRHARLPNFGLLHTKGREMVTCGSVAWYTACQTPVVSATPWWNSCFLSQHIVALSEPWSMLPSAVCGRVRSSDVRKTCLLWRPRIPRTARLAEGDATSTLRWCASGCRTAGTAHRTIRR